MHDCSGEDFDCAVGLSSAAQGNAVVAVDGVVGDDWRRGCSRIDLRANLGEAGERQVDGIAGAVGDGGRVEIDRSGGEGGGVLSGADGVAEGQSAAAGAAGIGRGAAVVEGERRGAAGNGDRLAQIERQRDGLAGVEITARR